MITTQSIETMLYLVLWFLLPLIPAFLLYRFLPNSGNVRGPLKGLTIKFTGAFAGYLVLFLLSMGFFSRLIQTSQIYEVWTVTGSVIDMESKRAIPVQYNPRMTLVPSNNITNGTFRFKIVGEKKLDLIEFPALSLEADQFISTPLELLDYDIHNKTTKTDWVMDYKHKTARLASTIKLSKENSISKNDTLYVQEY